MAHGLVEGRLTFGKYRDCTLEQVPTGYLGWLLDDNIATQYAMMDAVKAELRRRLQLPPGDPPVAFPLGLRVPHEVKSGAAQQIVQAGRRALAKKYHPDWGGDTATMQDINTTADWLESVLSTLLYGK